MATGQPHEPSDSDTASSEGFVAASTLAVRNALTRHRNELITLVALAAVTFATLLVFRREPVFSDDIGYWERWFDLHAPTDLANPYRLVLVVAAQIARLVFGHSMAAYSAVGIAAGVGLIVSIYALTRLAFPRVVAIGGALMLLTSTVFLQDATLLLPDWAAMVWFTAALVALLLAARQTNNEQPGTGQPRGTRLALLAGLLLFFALWTKEGLAPSLLAVPLALLVVTRLRHAIRLTMLAASSAIAAALAELLVLWMIYGDALIRLRVILGGHVSNRLSDRLGGRVRSESAQTTNASGSSSASTDQTTWWDLADRYLSPLWATSNGRWLLITFAFALAVTVIARSRRLWFLAVPAIVGLLTVMFAVGSIDPIVPMLAMKYRYLAAGWVYVTPLTAGAVWVAAQWATRSVANMVVSDAGRLAALPVRRWARWSATAAVIIVTAGGVVTGIAENYGRPVFIHAGADGLRQAGAVVNTLQEQDVPIRRIVADDRTQEGLRIQLRGDAMRLVDDASDDFTQARTGDLVILNHKRLGIASIPDRGSIIDEELLVPPAHWQYWANAEHADLFIYYVTDAQDEPWQSLTNAGTDVAGLLHAALLDEDDSTLDWQQDGHGLLAILDRVRNSRFVLGEGPHPQAPTGPSAASLHIEAPASGRIGVRIELHAARSVELPSLWLRTYGPDGSMVRQARLYQTSEEGRTSVPPFAVDLDALRAISFAGSLPVDPGDETFRVVIFARGTGLVTVDRVAYHVVDVS